MPSIEIVTTFPRGQWRVTVRLPCCSTPQKPSVILLWVRPGLMWPRLASNFRVSEDDLELPSDPPVLALQAYATVSDLCNPED